MTILVKVLIITVLCSFWWIWTNALTKPDDWKDARLGDKTLTTVVIVGMGVFIGWLIANIILA